MSIEKLTQEEISKFTTLVKGKSGRLTADQLVHLNRQGYSEYISKIKQDARMEDRRHSQTREHPLRGQGRTAAEEEKPRPKPQPQPSFYYSDKYEIMSMKEFIIILEESRRKQSA
jgi:hypothetical protein